MTIDFLKTEYKNSITFCILEFFKSSFKKSRVCAFFNEKNQANDYFSNSVIFIRLINFLFSTKIFFYSFKKYLDYFIDFCIKNPIKKILFFFLIISLLNLFIRENLFGNLFFIPLLSIIFLIIIINSVKKIIPEDHKKITLYLIICTFFIKLIALIILNMFFSFPDEVSTYMNFSWMITKKWLGYNLIELEFKKLENLAPINLYLYFNAVIYFIFGKHILITKLFNLFMHVATGIMMYFISKEIFDNRTAIFSTIIFYIMPTITFWSIVFLREAINIFFVALLFLVVLNLQKENKVTYYFLYSVLVVITIKILYRIRGHIAMLATFAVIVGFGVYLSIKILKKYPIARMIFLMMLLIGFFAYQKEVAEKINSTLKIDEYAITINHYRQTLRTSAGNFNYPEYVDISTPVKVLRFLPTAVMYGLFSPFPIHITNIKLLLYFIGNLVGYIILFFSVLGMLFAIKNKKVKIVGLITYIISTVVLFSLVEGNLGNLLRHSIQYTSFMIIFAAYGLSKISPEKIEIHHLKFNKDAFSQQIYTSKDTMQLSVHQS